MTEDINEIEEYKTYLISEYRANGGKKELSNATIKEIMNENDHQKRFNELEQELADARKGKPKLVPLKPVDKARENAELAKLVANSSIEFLDYIDPPFDIRVVDDDSFARDNQIGIFGSINGEVVVLRDNEGRVDCGGRSKYLPGRYEPIW